LHGSGIRNLRERADMTGGQFTLASSPSEGTCAHIIWLLDENDVAEGV
jgi:signal transduction histidine kinase